MSDLPAKYQKLAAEYAKVSCFPKLLNFWFMLVKMLLYYILRCKVTCS